MLSLMEFDGFVHPAARVGRVLRIFAPIPTGWPRPLGVTVGTVFWPPMAVPGSLAERGRASNRGCATGKVFRVG